MRPRQRRMGLSRGGYSGAHLLSAFNDRSTSNGTHSTAASKHPLGDNKAAMNGPHPHRQEEKDLHAPSQGPDDEEDIYAPPQSSDDEDDSASQQGVALLSDDESPRGDIQPSNFGKRAAAAKKESEHVHTNDCRGNVKTEPHPSSANENMFGVLISSNPRKKRKLDYGTKSSQRQPSNSSFSPKTVLKKLPSEGPSCPSTPQKDFQTPNTDGIEENESPTYPTTYKPRKISDLADSPLSGKSEFSAPEALESLSDTEDGPAFQNPRDLGLCKNEEDETKPKPDFSAEWAAPSQYNFRRPPTVEDIFRDISPEIDSPTMHSTLSELDEHVPGTESQPREVNSQPICPMCGEIVDAAFLEGYHEGRMNIRIQAKFCQAHKKRTAREVWTSRGYPRINWKKLDRRIGTHHRHLQDLLEGSPSYYRELLKDLMKSGKNRTLKQAMMSAGDSLTPGYYGSRGQRIMSENIMKRFSPALRSIAVKDRLLSAQGVAGYVQAVLVPELAVLLIQEDMSVGVENAREIMKESISLGDLVNEETEDIVTRHS